MALGFGRKKDATDAEANSSAPAPDATDSAPAVSIPSQHEASDASAFDLDAFATHLQSEGVATQSAPDDFTASNSGSAFDFPTTAQPMGAAELDAPDFNQAFITEERNAIAAGQIPPPILHDSDVPHQTGLYDPQVPVAQPKQKSPLLPILGVLAALGLAGGASMFLLRGNPDEETPATAPVSLRPQKSQPSQTAAPAPVQNVAVAPKNSNALPERPVSPVANPRRAALQNAARPVTPEVRARLKALWKQGAAAKHRGDLDEARRIWEQGLKLQPDNRGFIESIAKLGLKSNR
jgi:hypothetical protein